MTKNLMMFMVTVSIVFSTFSLFPSGEVSAASYTSGNCTVTMHTDYYRYTSTASTVDAWATASGCGTIYYDMEIKDQWGHTASSQEFSGYFSYRTPTKYFDIDYISDYNAGGRDSDAYIAEIDLYSDPGHTNFIGRANKYIIVEK